MVTMMKREPAHLHPAGPHIRVPPHRPVHQRRQRDPETIGYLRAELGRIRIRSQKNERPDHYRWQSHGSRMKIIQHTYQLRARAHVYSRLLERLPNRRLGKTGIAFLRATSGKRDLTTPRISFIDCALNEENLRFPIGAESDEDRHGCSASVGVVHF